MSRQELLQEHKKDKCKDCKIKDCNGIYITINNTTRCDRDEKVC